MSELKPCPFCGESAPDVEIHRNEIVCTVCTASSGKHFADDPITMWNTRPAEEQLRAKLEKANAAINEMKYFLETVIANKSQYSMPVGEDGYKLMANGKHHAKDLLKRLNEDFRGDK